MSYPPPPPGGYPMYGAPPMPGGGSQYPAPGPALGFDGIANQPPMGAPGYPPSGPTIPMPTAGGPTGMYRGMSSHMPPGMSHQMPPGMPVPSPNVGMPAPVPPTAGIYGGSAGPSMPQPGYPSGNLSFGGAAMATTAFPSHYRSQFGFPQPQPNLSMGPPPSFPPSAPAMPTQPSVPPAAGPGVSSTVTTYSSSSHSSSYSSHSSSSHSSSSGSSRSSIKKPEQSRGRPSIKPHANFCAQKDAEVLRNAMKGLGCDSKAITGLLCARTNAQRQKIELEYKTMYGRDLLKDLKYELGGNFETIVIALMMPLADYDATSLRKAIKGIGTDESVLIEILCTRTNAEIVAIKQSYQRLFSRDLEKDVAGDTSGHFKKFLISLLQAYRDESQTVDLAKAAADAQVLYKAGEGRWGTDESKFNTILVSRSFSQLKATFDEYSKISKYDFEDSIKREMSGDLRDGMSTIVQIVKNAPAFFAVKLYKSMKGLGTDDSTLIRIIVTRSEVDILDIKDEFAKLYHKSLAKFISDDTRGNYKKILLNLITENS